jgi:hypothetical protein
MAKPLGAGVAVLLALAIGGTPARAAGGLHVEEAAIRLAGGVNPSSLIQYYAIHGDVGFRLWRRADRWFAARGIAARWIVEPWVAFVDDDHGLHQTSSFEIGVSPLFAKLTFFDRARLRPFLEGGEGILYTDLRKQRLGTRMQFSSQIGGGIEYRIRPDLGLTFAARLRHMSNAGLAGSNPGVNTLFGLVGLTFR